jgi:uncharacterized protein YuzE
MKNICHRIDLEKDVCYIRFACKDQKYEYSEEIGETIRGEELIVDFNKKGKIIGIELLGSELAPKPCQN